MSEQTNFNINITADAVKAVSEAKATQEALKQVANTSAAAGEESSKAADKATGKHQEFKKALSELGKEFPVLGALGRVMFNPIALGAAAITYAIRKLKADIAALNESLSTPEWEGYGAVVSAQKKALEEAASGASAFAREMERIRDATETASQASEKLVTVFKAQMSAQDKLDDARKRMETAQVEAGEKDPVRKQAKLLEIEERYAARKRQRADDTAKFELDQQRKKMENEQAAVETLDKQLVGAREKQQGLKSEAAINEKIRVEKGRLAAEEEDYRKKSERKEQLEGKPWAFRSTAEQWELNYLNEKLGPQGDTIARQKRFVSALEREAPGSIEAWRSGQENISMLEGMRRGAAERAGGIAANLPTQERVAAIESQARNEGGRMDSVARLAQAAARGGAEQERLAEEAAKQYERTGQFSRQTVEMWKRQTDLNEQLLANQKRLESQLANQRTR